MTAEDRFDFIVVGGGTAGELTKTVTSRLLILKHCLLR